MLHVVGGVYRESCLHPNWCEVFGSAGRAVSAIARIGGQATLHAHLDSLGKQVIEERAALEEFGFCSNEIDECSSFRYDHGLSKPTIHCPSNSIQPIEVQEESVVRFGMIDSDAIVRADFAVYDPQSATAPKHFHENGSSAEHLAVVLNNHEASLLARTKHADLSETAQEIARASSAEVVIIKMGARGALVLDRGEFSQVPAFRTARVWKLGSGDNYVAHFAFNWISKRLSAAESALRASKATAYYCENRGFPTERLLSRFDPRTIQHSERYLEGFRPTVYLAGPFFTLAELWLVEQARINLREMGLTVFSPFHDVGRGSADDVVELDLKAIRESDLVFAIGDGMDPGTVYEVGYARACGKPVVWYSENESDEDTKMMQGSGCMLVNDYVSAIYQALWVAAEL